MIRITCPNCGPRNSSEFRHAGEARPRPDVATTTPQEWRAYLYLRDNPAGWTTETWYHAFGCRRFFRTERHTVTNGFRETGPNTSDAPGAAEPGVVQ